MNKLTLIGYVGGEPEIRLTKDSDPVCSFRVATNEWISPERVHTEWFSVTTFGKLALQCSKRIGKGSRVYIEGKLRTETYLDRNDTKKDITKIYSSNVIFLDSANHSEIESPQTLEVFTDIETTEGYEANGIID